MQLLELFINLILLALKNLWRRKVRTLLTVVAVSIGTMAVVSLVSIATGAKNVFIGQLEKTGALTQITVIASNEIESIDFMGGGSSNVDGEKMTAETVQEVKALTHVIDVSPQVNVWSLRSVNLKGSDKKYPTEITAVEPNQAIEVSLTSGRFIQSQETNKVVLSYKLAEALSKENNNLSQLIGQILIFTLEKGHFTENMSLPEDNIKRHFEQQEKLRQLGKHEEANQIKYPLDEITNTVEAEIVGIGTPGPRERNSYITLTWAEELMTRKNIGGPKHDNQGNLTGEYEIHVWDELEEKGYHALIAKIDHPDNVEIVAEEIKNKLDRGAVTAKDFLDSFLRIFTIIQIALGGIGGIALLVAAIGIINTMLMAVLERTREIGLLKAVGATAGMVGWIFTFEAGLIGILGGLTGVGGGIGLSKIINRIASQQLAAQNFEIEKIITFPLWLIGGTLVFSFLLGVLSGLIPAIRASKLNPIDALRAE